MEEIRNKNLELFPHYTPVYYWNKDSDKRINGNQGGTASSKTYSIIQLICKKLMENSNWIATITAQSFPNLKKGALRDFKRILKTSPLLRASIKDPTLIRGPYIFKNGSELEFNTTVDAQDAKSGKREMLLINEANGLDFESARQLISRTSKHVYLDWNPDAKFWFHHYYLGRKDVNFYISNFTHNKYCAEATVSELLSYRDEWEKSGNQELRKKWLKTNNKKDFKEWLKTSSVFWKNKWYVYGLGLTGVAEGVIFEHIKYVDHLPFDLIKKGYALDFGFNTDPLAFSKIGEKGGKIYAKELIYDLKITTPKLIKLFKSFGVNKKDLIIADTNNPDAIAQLQKKGYNVIPAHKPPGSRKAGFEALQGKEINITRDSKNWILEQQLFKYKRVRGEFTNDPQDGDDHLWDGLSYWHRYWYPITNIKGKRKKKYKRKLKLIG